MNPNCEVDRYILDPVGEVVAIELAPEPIANHRAVATAGQLRYQLACDVEPLGRVSVIRFDKPPIEFVRVLTLGRAADGGLQQVIGLKPALLDPGRCWPGIKADVGGAQHLVDGNLVETDVPVCRMKRKSVKHHVLAAGVLRAHGHWDTRVCGSQHGGLRVCVAIRVTDVVRMVRRDRVAARNHVRMRHQGIRGIFDRATARSRPARAVD